MLIMSQKDKLQFKGALLGDFNILSEPCAENQLKPFPVQEMLLQLFKAQEKEIE